MRCVVCAARCVACYEVRCAFRSALRYDLQSVQCTGPSYTPRQSTLRSKLLSDLSQKSTVDDNEKDCVAQMDKKGCEWKKDGVEGRSGWGGANDGKKRAREWCGGGGKWQRKWVEEWAREVLQKRGWFTTEFDLWLDSRTGSVSFPVVIFLLAPLSLLHLAPLLLPSFLFSSPLLRFLRRRPA